MRGKAPVITAWPAKRAFKMARYLPVLLFLTALSCSLSEEHVSVEGLLRKYITSLEEGTQTDCSHYSIMTSVNDIANKSTGTIPLAVDQPVFGFSLCHNQYAHESMGNHLANYFGHATCAKATGSHFVAPHGRDRGVNRADLLQTEIFFEELPDLLLQEAPNSMDQRKAAMALCADTWNTIDNPNLWTHVEFIANTMQHALGAYLLQTKDKHHDLLTVNAMDLATKLPSNQQHLPLIPEVSIHYRCGDNVQSHAIGHGLMPFTSILPLIPKGAASIYVMTEAADRFFHSKGIPGYAIYCSSVVQWLFDNITALHPQATVVVKKGGDIIEDLARMALAKTTICSSSTFCFFPAIANKNTVHFPYSELTLNHRHAVVHPAWHWMEDPHLISHDWPHPWYIIKFELWYHGNPPMSELEGRPIKGSGRSVWLVREGYKRAFGSGSVFEGMGFDWNEVYWLPDNVVNAIPSGPDINSLRLRS